MKELAFGDKRSRRVDTRPTVREGLDEFFYGGIVGGECGDEVGDGGSLVWGVVEGGW